MCFYIVHLLIFELKIARNFQKGTWDHWGLKIFPEVKQSQLSVISTEDDLRIIWITETFVI